VPAGTTPLIAGPDRVVVRWAYIAIAGDATTPAIVRDAARITSDRVIRGMERLLLFEPT
jgi:hypothetical protein